MRILLKLIASLVIAAGICGALVFTGLLRFGQAPEKVDTALTEPSDPPALQPAMDAGTPMAAEGKPLVKSADSEPEPDVDADVSENPPEVPPAENIASPSGDIAITGDQNRLETDVAPASLKRDPAGTTDKAPYISIEGDIHQQALSYLYFLEKDDSGNVERRFSQFLKTEFDFSEDRIDQVLQMAFWKNFLVLQKTWAPGDADLLQQAFDKELALKKAGFAAKGIQLMPAEINAAETRLTQMLQQLAASAGKQDAYSEGTP